MVKNKKDKEPMLRQIILSGLNEQVQVLSAYEKEDLDFLAEKAFDLYRKIQSKGREKDE